MIAAPSSLPAIDTVEIIDLRAINANQITDYLANSSSAPRWSFVGKQAQLLAEIWRALPPGEQSRCHTPPFGYRFYAAGELIAEASVCWACSNLYGSIESRQLHYAFDASHVVSQKLLAESQRLTGVVAKE